jgi:PAS domain S-box-containing protein
MAPDIIYIYDPVGSVIDQNKAAVWMFGLSREEAVGKTGMMTQLAEEDRARFAKIREDTFKHGEWRGELKGKRDLGHES